MKTLAVCTWVLVAVTFALGGCGRQIRRVGAYPAAPSGIAVSLQPSPLFHDGAIERVQRALIVRELLPPRHGSGNLDAATRRALRAFQRGQRLPETGLPTYRTVRSLGLDPAEIFLEKEALAAEGADLR